MLIAELSVKLVGVALPHVLVTGMKSIDPLIVFFQLVHVVQFPVHNCKQILW